MTSTPIIVSAHASGNEQRWKLLLPLLLVSVLVLIALMAPLIAPYTSRDQIETLTMDYRPPSPAHPFGTDALSRDVLSRVIYGSRVSLSVASLSVAIALTVGIAFGALAAFGNRFVESTLMRTLDVLLSVPRLLVLLAVTAFWEQLSVPALALLLGATGWHDIARLVHGETRTLLSRDFIVAAGAGGVGRARLFLRHMLPHLIPVLTVSATLGIASTISIEAGLSFLGLGLQEPDVSWGMIMRDGVAIVNTKWWLTIFPGLAIVIAVIACNALGEALRDHFARRQLPA